MRFIVLCFIVCFALLMSGCPTTTPGESCDGITCSDVGECVVGDGTPRCLCPQGYRAEDLQCLPAPCNGVDCSGHGSCVENDEGAQCQCDAGYHSDGLQCLADEPGPCAGVTCSEHGQCQVENDQAQCLCDEGYHSQGLDCVEDDPDPCAGVTCSEHGQCQVENDMAQCVCDEGYEAQDLECLPDLCTCYENYHAQNTFCTYRQSCTSASDCCPANVPAPYVCNQDYPYIYQCQDGVCATPLCTQDSQCDAKFINELDDGSGTWTNLGCVERVDPCTGEVASRNCVYEQECVTAADCCPAEVPDPYVCNQDYPHVYICENGKCKGNQCLADSQCDTYFQQTTASAVNPMENDGCIDTVDPCTGEVWFSYCGIAQACVTADDCCPDTVPGGLVCNQDYPYRFVCENSRCKRDRCTDDAHCQAYYDWAFTYLPGWLNLGCLSY